MFYVYVLRSVSSDNFYIGSTNNLKRRFLEHNGGKSFYTERYKPWLLVYYEAYESENLARLREKRLKYNGNARKELMKRILPSKSGAGYTLIEILVGLTIVGLLFAFGFVSFREFSRRQALLGAARSLKGDLRLAQEQALAGNKPSDPKCNVPNLLDGYYFRAASGSYTIEAACSGGSVITKSVNLPSDISMTTPSPNPILFKVLGQGTNLTSSETTITLTQAASLNIQTVTVTAGGEIK